MRAERTRRRTTKAAWVGLVLIVSLVGWVGWSLFVPHTFETKGPIDVSRAKRRSPIDLPSTARNVQIASHSHWISYAHFVRFECPVADAEAHAKILLPGERGTEISMQDLDWFKMPSGKPNNPGETFRDLSWFDLENIDHGVQFGGGGPGEAKIIIDRDRGVFYYTISD